MNLTKTTSTFTNLACAFCDKPHSKDALQKLCHDCNRPLFARYDLNKARKTLTKENLKSRPQNMWRYEEVLPVQYKENIVTMNEGWTRTVFAERLGKFINCKKTYIKDESTNPTSSFKARGLSMAVSRATELGATRLAIPSAGNAAGAMSAYAALKGVPAHVFMPVDVPKSFIAECTAFGAQINLVNGLITDCGVKVREGAETNGWFDVSTLREPYRVEGKKTMGYEIVEQLNWEVPDVIIYPTGGGTGLIGVWKALEEMEQLGLIGSKRPRMVSVQSTGCSPIVKAFQDGDQFATKWEGAKTIADGLRVPAALGDFLVLKALRESNGIALSVTDEEMVEACCTMGKYTGIFAAPEGGACLAAQMKLLKEGWIKEDETVVIFNTGTGLKYTHCFVKN